MTDEIKERVFDVAERVGHYVHADHSPLLQLAWVAS